MQHAIKCPKTLTLSWHLSIFIFHKGWVVVLDPFYWYDILKCTYASKGTKKASILQPVIMLQNEGVCRMQLSSNCFVSFKRNPLKRHKSLQLPQTKADSVLLPRHYHFINTWVRFDRFASLFLTISFANPYFGSVFFFFYSFFDEYITINLVKSTHGCRF